jgi:putative nucleotidyltransferase with HDIG domain
VTLKIKASQLRPGMYLTKLGGSWIKHPFLRSAFVIKSAEDIAKIHKSGITEVWIDPDKGLGLEPETEPPLDPQPEPQATATPRKVKTPTQAPVSVKAELNRARKICLDSKEAVSSMFAEARMGNAVSAEQAEPLVQEIAESVTRNPGALINVARLKTVDDYTYMHSVAVCALMTNLGRQLGLEESLLRAAGIGGLLHDLGKALMPLEVLNKPGKLTDAEFAIMKTHPTRGFEMLKEGGTSIEPVLDIALHHHEKVDGSGYPDGLSGDDITLLAKMGAICDVYDAITSTRPYKSGWDPAVSLQRMASWQGHFDNDIFKAFVKSVGIYPLGSLVRLESGRLGIVMESNPEAILTPQVKVFYSVKLRQMIPPKLLDLANSRNQDRITAVEDSAKWGFNNLDQLWVEG